MISAVFCFVLKLIMMIMVSIVLTSICKRKGHTLINVGISISTIKQIADNMFVWGLLTKYYAQCSE